MEATRAHDSKGLLQILGKAARPAVFSGDSEADQEGQDKFTSRASEGTRLVNLDKLTMLYVGPGNWPFPFPLRHAQSGWYFDTPFGLREVMVRRVGQNEINAMQVCRAMAAAQSLYSQFDRDGDGIFEFATSINSKPGKVDGLYWAPKPGRPESPLGELAGLADATGTNPVPYHGYYYKLLTGQGPYAKGGAHPYLVNGHMLSGYAILAYPAQWRRSGVMTFMLNQNGQLYERNLGAQTSKLAPAIQEFDPDANWHLVKE